MLAYEMNGAPLPPQHGAPLRLIVPGWYGMAHVKWLRRITVIREKFDGFQMRAYRLRDTADEPGIPLTRIEPRALLMPPGFPDFMSRRRVVRSGAVKIEGRAWSGWAPVSMVEVSIDGGDTWELADLDASAGRPRLGTLGHGPGSPSRAATCCPAGRRMPVAGLNRVGNGGVAVGSPTTPSNGSPSLSSVRRCDVHEPGQIWQEDRSAAEC